MRAAVIAALLAAVLREATGPPGVLVEIHGAGGFGKTMLARLVHDEARVIRRFRGHIYPMALGREVTSQRALALNVNELVGFITGVQPDFADPAMAGAHLGRTWTASAGGCCSPLTTCGRPSRWRRSWSAASACVRCAAGVDNIGDLTYDLFSCWSLRAQPLGTLRL